MTLQRAFEGSYIMQPSVLLTIGTLFFLALSSVPPSLKTVFVILSALAAFFIGEYFGMRKFVPNIKISNESLLYFGAVLFIIGLAALYLNLKTSGGVPLLNDSLRRFLNPVLTHLSFLVVPASFFIIAAFSEKKYQKIYAALLITATTALIALLGFRTEVLAAIIGGVLTAYYSKIFRLRELMIFALFALIVFSSFTYMRTFGFETSRATITISALNFLVQETPLFGLTHGYVEFSDLLRLIGAGTPAFGGRVLVASILGGREMVSITSTLYGPPFVDFGVLGIIVFLFFGSVLGAGYKAVHTSKSVNAIAPLHSLVLAFLLLGIETGIADLIVWVYFSAAALFYMIAHKYETQ